MSVLEMQGVCAGYGGGDILHDVTLALEEGTVTCVVGPNGAGKSTVMRAISGVLHPRVGQILFKGDVISKKEPKDVLTLGIVQVPQNRSLFPQMTVEENVRLGAYTIRQQRDLVESRLDTVKERFPIVKERAKDKAGALSGGQQKLVEFARSLMLDPSLILLDEPSMGLEPRFLSQVFETMRSLCSDGRTVLLVEQNAKQGLANSHRGIVMESGRILIQDAADAILQNPEIGDLYLGGRVAK